jgi:hypothetical protein
MIPVNFTKNILAPATPVNPAIDSLPLTIRAAFNSLSSLRSDSVKKCFRNRQFNAKSYVSFMLKEIQILLLFNI